MRVRAALAVAAVGAVAGCGSGGTQQVSSASLKPRLLATLPGLQPLRSFDWSDPVDFVGEGLRIPQATHPSSVVKELQKEGYSGGAGVELAPQNQPESGTFEGVAKLKSPAAAEKMRDFLHAQDLTPPCFTQCSFSPKPLAMPGVPTAKAVTQLQQGPPPGAPPPPRGARIAQPSNYLVEFTVGPYLYVGSSQGIPQQGTAQRFIRGTKAAYVRATGFK